MKKFSIKQGDVTTALEGEKTKGKALGCDSDVDNGGVGGSCRGDGNGNAKVVVLRW